MKRALLNSLEPGRICEVVDEGNEFEVHESFSWVDVPDDTNTQDRYNLDTQQVEKFDPLSIPGFAENGYQVARQIAYSPIGNQLDMLFKELQNTGTISNTGPWATHVASVKAEIPKDDPAAVLEWNRRYYQEMFGNTSPQ